MAKNDSGGGRGGQNSGGKSSGANKSGSGKTSAPSSRVSNSQPGRAPNNPKTGQMMSNRQMVGSRIEDIRFKAPGTGTNFPGQANTPQGKLKQISPTAPSWSDRIVSAATSPFSRQSTPDLSRALSNSISPYRQTAAQAVAGGAPSLGNRREQARFMNENIGDPGLSRMRNPAATLAGYVNQPRMAKDQSRIPQAQMAAGIAFNPAAAGPFTVNPGDPASQRYAKTASYLGSMSNQRQPAQLTAGLSRNPFEKGYAQTAARFPSFNTQVGTDALNSFENARVASVPSIKTPTSVNVPGGDLPVGGTVQRSQGSGFFGNVANAVGKIGFGGSTARSARDLERGNKGNSPYMTADTNGYGGAKYTTVQSPLLPPAIPARQTQYGRYRFPQYSQSWAFNTPYDSSYVI